MSRSAEQFESASAPSVAGFLLSGLLVLDVVLGGSLRGVEIVTAALEGLACLVLIWCVVDPRLARMRASAWWLLAIVGVGCLAAAVQLIPLPQEIWSGLPGRANVVAGFEILGVAAAEQPASLAPDETLSGLLRVLPPLAVFVLAAKLPWRLFGSHARWTLIGLAVFSVALGLAQLLVREQPMLFPYGARGIGQAAGIFEVVNHQATLQLMALPFIGVWLGRLATRFSLGDEPLAQAFAIAGAFLVLTTGVILSGSFAGYALFVPVALVSGLLVLDARPTAGAVAGAIVLLIALVALVYLVLSSPMVGQLGATDFGDGPLSRRGIWERTLPMIADYFPVGSGLGSFETVYPGYEAQATVTASFVTHAHSDYLELAAELGLAGCAVLAGLIVWWIVLSAKAWRVGREEGGKLKRAASIAVGVVLMHSLVDAPVRTEAIACLGALCLGILCSSRQERAPAGSPAAIEMQATFRHKHIEI